jgi:hypothetical protein
MAAASSRLNLVDSIVVLNTSAFGVLVTGLATEIYCRRSCFVGGGYGIYQSSAGLCGVTIQSGSFYGQTVDHVGLAGARARFISGIYAFGTGQTFVRILGANSNVLIQNTSNVTKGCVITGKTTAAITIQQNNADARASNCVITTLGTTVTIDSCANGIVLETSGNTVDITAATITNSTSWGVNSGGNKLAGFNQVMTSSATSMSGNGSGDFTLDGTTAISIATLRADPDKDMLEAVRVNRLAEY